MNVIMYSHSDSYEFECSASQASHGVLYVCFPSLPYAFPDAMKRALALGSVTVSGILSEKDVKKNIKMSLRLRKLLGMCVSKHKVAQPSHRFTD
jgi:hypothetical protein